MAKFKVVTPAGISYGTPGTVGYEYEMEALAPLGAEIVEVAAKTEEEFAKAARDADALYAKGRPITRTIIDALERCRIIALGSVGSDSVDVRAATARGIPVTNVPDTFIEEVAARRRDLGRSEFAAASDASSRQAALERYSKRVQDAYDMFYEATDGGGFPGVLFERYFLHQAELWLLIDRERTDRASEPQS